MFVFEALPQWATVSVALCIRDRDASYRMRKNLSNSSTYVRCVSGLFSHGQYYLHSPHAAIRVRAYLNLRLECSTIFSQHRSLCAAVAARLTSERQRQIHSQLENRGLLKMLTAYGP